MGVAQCRIGPSSCGHPYEVAFIFFWGGTFKTILNHYILQKRAVLMSVNRLIVKYLD